MAWRWLQYRPDICLHPIFITRSRFLLTRGRSPYRSAFNASKRRQSLFGAVVEHEREMIDRFDGPAFARLGAQLRRFSDDDRRVRRFSSK